MKKKTFHLITSGILSVSLLLGSVVAVQGAEDELFFGQEDYSSPTEYVEDEYSMDGNNAESDNDNNNDEYSFDDASFSDEDGVITEEIAQEEWSGSPEEYTEPQSSYQSEIPDTGVDDYASAETEEVQDSLVTQDYAQGPDEFLSATDAGDITSSPEVTEDIEPEEIHEELLGGPLDPYAESAYGTPAFASASDIDASNILTTCDVYDGSNVEYQNYRTWSSPVTSYLTTSPGGGLMRVQSGAIDGKLLIEYYDRSYNIQGNVTLNLSYPIFGGFFEGPDAYYVLTGQKNKEQSNDKVVFDVAKYTKNWDYVASAYLTGVNTTVPFDAGSARFAMSGKYLIVRTCHEMYTSSDGYNHQANVTIQIDTDTMRVTDYFTDVANSSVGYVSHSFNQFVFIEDDAIVSLDHGDAYPRGLTLIKYPSTISSGYFESGWRTQCLVGNVFSFPGEIGDNYTGASVGGFLASDSHYLIAGNYNGSSDRYAARNVFVEAVPKSGGSPVVRYYTSYAGSSDTASTPHLVSLGSNRFLLLWSSQATVYYLPIDGSGQACGNLYSFKGNLSDCVPQVIGNKVVWYTWNYDTNVFYEINTSDLSDHDAVIIVNGHKYEFNTPSDNGEIEGRCWVCGKQARFAVPTGMMILWKKDATSYWNFVNSELNPGGQLEYMVRWTYSSDLTEKLDDCEVISSDPEILCPNGTGSISVGTKKGSSTITIRSRYNQAVTEDYTFYVNCLYDDAIEQTDYYQDKVYTGSPIEVPLKVTFAGKTLAEGIDYKLIWSDNINAGTARVTAEGIGEYTGSGTTTFTIRPISLEEEMFTVPSSPLTETGSALEPKVSGSADGVELKEGVDYEITGYSSNIDPGTGYVIIKGKGNYKGDFRIPFQIGDHKYEFIGTPKNGEIEEVCRNCGKKKKCAVPTGVDVWWKKQGSYFRAYNGIELSPGEKIDYDVDWSYSSALKEKLGDCEVSISDPDMLFLDGNSSIIAGSKSGKATVTFRSKYNPAVSADYTFYVNCLYDDSIEQTNKYEEIVYAGSPLKAQVKVTFDGKTLTEGTDYKLSWSENINAGTAKVTAQGIGKYTGSGSTTFTIKPAYLKKEMFTVPSAPLTETGSQLKPKVSGGELREGVDYEITGYTSNTYPGTGYVVVSGKGNYQGDCRIPFEIKKSPTPIKRIDASMFTVPSSPFIETGSQIKPSVVGSADGKKLKKGTDYVIDGYSSNVKPGTGYVIVRGIGDYGGTCSVPFVIISDSTLYISISKDPLLAGESATISVTGAKGKISYKSSNSAVATVSGKGIVTAKKPGTATITVKDKTKSAKIKIHVVPGATSSIKAVNTASGVKVTWSKVTGATGYDLYCDGNMVLSNRNVLSYTGYASNGRTYTYKVVARCSAGASTKSKFVKQTYLKQPEITELTSRKSGRIGCWWSKNKDSSGSEMQYSTQKDFKSGIKTVDVPKTDTRNYVVNGLPSGKTYYVRVRRYKKSGNQKTYSAWSVVKSIRVS